MRFTWRSPQTKRSGFRLLTVLYILSGLSVLHGSVYAEPSNPVFECKDLLLLFTRGSGQNPDSQFLDFPFEKDFQKAEKESAAFFNQFKTHLDVEYPHVTYKPVSIHDFPGKYDPVGYKAVGVGIFTDPDNLANSEVSMIPGDYRESVEHGVAETVGYLKDQINSCPSQSIVVGGYSQGAQVMGDALAQLSPLERSRILGVSFVGDPKFIAAHGDSLVNPFDKAISYPWRRGDVTNHDQGMLEPRIPYVPEDIEKRTASYCYRVDIICSGWSGVNKDYRQAHSSYAAEPTRNNVNELMQWAAPTLAQAERAAGGLGTIMGGNQSPEETNKPKDVMLLLNDDAMANALYSFRYDTDLVLSGISSVYPNVNYAAKGFGETDDGETYIPRVDNIQSFMPYTGYNVNNPSFSTSNLYNAFASRYPFGNQAMGNGDWADPHVVAVEKSAFASGWRPEAEKHIVLVTDRPPKTTYSFNLCNGTVRSWMHVPETNGYIACYINGGVFDIWPKVQHSEFCATVYLAITNDQCKNPITKPGNIQMTTRTLNDAIIAAQSQHIAVDVVIPNKITNQYFPQLVPKMANDLEYLAKATGGIFINYNQRDKFDKAAYSDMMYQVLSHKPKDITIAYKEALETKDGFKSGQVLGARINQPVILDASQSNARFSAYNWDFNNDGQWDETSPGPVVEHVFDTPQTSFVRIAGLIDSGVIETETHLAVNVTQADPPQPPTLPAVPDVSAKANSDGSITLSWQSDEQGTLVVTDPDSGLPLVSADLTEGALTLSAGSGLTSLGTRVVTDGGSSQPTLVQVEPLLPPLVVTNDPGPEGQTPADPPQVQGPEEETPSAEEATNDTVASPQEPDPTICYKLQQCVDESTQAGQFVLETPFVNQSTISAPQPAIATPQDTIIANQPEISANGSKPQVKGTNTTREIANNEETTSSSRANKPYLLWIFVLIAFLISVVLYRRLAAKYRL